MSAAPVGRFAPRSSAFKPGLTMTTESKTIIDKLFSIETWERLDWLNQKWNKTIEEKNDIVKSAGVLPLVVMSLILFIGFQVH